MSESADEHDQSSGSDHNLTQSSQQLQDAVGRTESKESTSKQNQEVTEKQQLKVDNYCTWFMSLSVVAELSNLCVFQLAVIKFVFVIFVCFCL